MKRALLVTCLSVLAMGSMNAQEYEIRLFIQVYHQHRKLINL